MAELVAGALWAALVAYLLSRVLRQGHAFAAATLPASGMAGVAADVAIIVPMRDEIANVDACLGALLAQRDLGGRCEIVAVDDNSTDGTADRVARIAATEPRLRLLRAGTLPPQWTGKSHACWLGAAASRSEWLCFVDADLRATSTLVASAITAARKMQIDMLSLSPFQELGSFWERLIMPAGMLTIAGAMDLQRIGDPAVADVTANGQFLLFRRAAYEAIGGHRAVRGEICEDKALARLVKHHGGRFRLMGAEHLARTRMYRELGALWDGLAKNAVEVLGSTAASVTAASAAAAISWATVALPLGIALATVGGAASATKTAGLVLCLLASLALFGTHLGTIRHCRVALGYSALFPAAYAVVAALAWYSLALRRAGRVQWKGRTYRIEREAAPPRS